MTLRARLTAVIADALESQGGITERGPGFPIAAIYVSFKPEHDLVTVIDVKTLVQRILDEVDI